MKLVAANLVALKYLLYMTVFHMLFTSIFSFRHQQKLRHIYKKLNYEIGKKYVLTKYFLLEKQEKPPLR